MSLETGMPFTRTYFHMITSIQAITSFPTTLNSIGLQSAMIAKWWRGTVHMAL